LLSWSDAEKLPWDILLLFGGGLALAEAMGQVGWVESLAHLISDGTSGPWWWVLLVLITLALFLTEGMSNLALTVVMVPVVAALAVEWGLHPALFAVPIALSSSCAFMLPMATPPNAIVFGSRQIAIREMMWVGLGLNLLCIVLVFVLSVWVLPGWCEQLGATP
jgi:sodium-dependent dicarboxylate transporter 2/3/5